MPWKKAWKPTDPYVRDTGLCLATGRSFWVPKWQRIASIPLIRCNLMASNIHILIHIIETTMHRRKSPYEDLSDLRSFNRKQGQKSRKSPQGHLPLHKATIFFSYFFLVKWLILKLDFQSPKSRRPSTSTLLKYGHLNMFRLYTSDNVLMMQALVPGKVLQEFGGKPKNLNREWRGPVFFSSFKEWGGGGWDTWRTLWFLALFCSPPVSNNVPHVFPICPSPLP